MKHPLPFTAALVVLFFAAQLVGLFVVQNYVDADASREHGERVYRALPYSLERPDADPLATLVLIALAVLIGTALLFIIIHFRKPILWKLWYLLSVFLTLSIALAAFLPVPAAALLSALGAAWKVFRPQLIVHNATEVLIYGGLAAIFAPLLTVATAAILLIFISGYDMIAVWKSRHMVRLAEFQTSSRLFAGFSMPYGSDKPVLTPQKARKNSSSRSAILGGGDIGFPLLFSSVVLPEFGFAPTLLVAAGATIALAILLALSKKGKFYPAMPFISAGCFVGYGIARLLA